MAGSTTLPDTPPGPSSETGPDQAPRTATRGRDARVAATGVVVVLLVWFAVANLQHVHIRFWLWSAGAPLIVVVVISCALGFAMGGLAARARRRRGPGR